MFVILKIIGYPDNAQALPWIVDHIDRNSSADNEMIELLNSIPADALAPHIIRRLLDPNQSQSWGYDVESICVTLQKMAPDYSQPCLYSLVYLLCLHLDPTILDVGFIIDTIERTGRVGTALAAPALLFIVRTANTPEAVEQARNVFASLPPEMRRLYELVAGYIDLNA